MFEFSIIRKYLIPQRKQLSVALIASMSVGVIALVVWLVLIFLSVTEGIEKNWLDKLTSLNAPLRINPTQAYFSSYYYLSDSFSSSAGYSYKNISQKSSADSADPYNPDIDQELPPYCPSPHLDAQGNLVDPVKIAYQVLQDLKKEDPSLCFQDYELSGAMLKLDLKRPNGMHGESQTQLSQASYLLSFADQSPFVTSLILKPSLQDIQHLAAFAPSDLLKTIHIRTLKTPSDVWRLPSTLIPENTPFLAFAYVKNGKIMHVVLPKDVTEKPSSELIQAGNVVKMGHQIIFNHTPLSLEVPLFVQEGMTFEILPTQELSSSLQGHPLKGMIPLKELEVAAADISAEFTEKSIAQLKERGVLLSKNFQDSGVLIGDKGFLSYEAATAGSVQEQRLPIHVAGFYDPGIMPVGNRCILVDPAITHLINAATHNQYLEKTLSSGIQVWFKNIDDAQKLRTRLSHAFAQSGIDKYWKITTYHEYDFAKDLLQQFQSDRYLFTLIGLIILIVACCNIISMLVILVNDKKKEIGILQAMGATQTSIACIFGGCGAAIGFLSCLFGVGAALITLHHLDTLVHLLSFVQGHDAFNVAFFGKSLPNQLSSQALFIILIATPVISFLAGLVPAIQACRLKPSAILRSE